MARPQRRFVRPFVILIVPLLALAGCGAYGQSLAVQYGDAAFRTLIDLLITDVINEVVSPAPPDSMPPPSDPCEDVSCGADEVCVDGACVPRAATGDPDAGMMFYFGSGCDACHGPNGNDGFAPGLIGVDADSILDKLSGNVAHGGGVVDGVTPQDAADVQAWLDSL